MKTPGISVLLLIVSILLFAADAESAERTLIPGLDYVKIPDGKPLKPAGGKVVVEEFFSYACPVCDNFEPWFAPWVAKQPAWVKVVYIPASFRPDFRTYAKAFYAAQAYGLVKKTHEAAYNAIHDTHTLPGEGMRINDKTIASFYAHYGVSAKQFLAKMHSAAVAREVREASDHLQKSKVTGTPSLLIDGRYLVRGRNFPDMLWIASALIDKEHKRPVANQ